ncbi:MAG: amidohydrolase [Anaerolineales bacterium]|jgi:hypothetical protein|nr:amidohydrolase [Anaerolineales bacterium]MDP7643987.1 amidohydrolase [Anaerolineales bacterium]HJN40830.1 amidohydrolase [Anaerolineales bacterium]|tara:strand:- start:563 stop:2173 length:1611 start_codon:yes stop_codon:yes gene_type:complete
MPPEFALVNGRIRTLDAQIGAVQALAVRGERISAAGTDDEIAALADAHTEVIDLRGRLVLPGLTDAHCHFEQFARTRTQIDAGQTSKQRVLEMVAERAAATPSGEWISGHGWNQTDWDGEFPTAAELDAVAPEHVVFLTARSLHMAWVNSLALRRARVDSDSADPPGGRIGRDASGTPSGCLFETAIDLVSAVIPEPTVAELAAMMEAAQRAAWRVGLTGLHDYDRRSAFLALQQLRSEGKLGLRVVKNIPVELLDETLALGLRSGFGDDWLRIGGIKVFMDGALGPRTASMISPYENESGNYGMVVTDKEQLFECASRASANEMAMTVHAIGDRANHDALDVLAQLRREEAARGQPPAARRHRIEHVQLLHPDDYQRLGALQLIASMQPIHATADMFMADRHWGARAAGAYAWRTQLSAGATLAFGSDAPVESINPVEGIHAAVTRKRADGTPGPDGWFPQQRLSVEEAVRAYTLGSAYAAHQEEQLGTLQPGKLADLIVLDRDIFRCDPMEIHAASVLGTMVGGEWKQRAPELS